MEHGCIDSDELSTPKVVALSNQSRIISATGLRRFTTAADVAFGVEPGDLVNGFCNDLRLYPQVFFPFLL